MVRRKKRVSRFLYSMTPNVVKHEKKTLDYKRKVPPITRSSFAPTLYCKMETKPDAFFSLRIDSTTYVLVRRMIS